MSKEKLPEPQFKVGVTTGLWVGGQEMDTASAVRKLGYGLTRGADVIELAGNVPQEVNYTEGKEIRYIVKSQGLELLFHGSLTVPMCMPERAEWRDAQNHIKKSLRSAVFAGAKYIDFHSCLNYWLELMTYAGRKLTMAFCDHEGNFISKILWKSKKLREWFVDKRWYDFYTDILSREEISEAVSRAEIERIEWLRKKQQELTEKATKENWSQGQLETAQELLRREAAEKETKQSEIAIKEKIRDRLKKNEPWHREELRAVVGILDGYHILAHYMYYENDPVWVEMVKIYEDLIEKYKKKIKKEDGIEYNDEYWLDKAWEKAERDNDREFKEFYYAVVAAKFLEGHITKAIEWLENEKDGFLKELENYEDKDELKEIAKNLKIAIENPDSREPQYGGLYLIWKPTQIYVAVKVIRDRLKTDRVAILLDFEHLATQGVDPLEEIKNFVQKIPDAGKYIISCHMATPNPLHTHLPIEYGDTFLYEILWELRKAGLGKHNTVYLIYERGGFKDPFKHSVFILKLMKFYLEKDTAPDDLPSDFFGIPASAKLALQRIPIFEHAWDPLKGVLAVPEEQYTYLGKAALEKGKKPEEWKKEEVR